MLWISFSQNHQYVAEPMFQRLSGVGDSKTSVLPESQTGMMNRIYSDGLDGLDPISHEILLKKKSGKKIMRVGIDQNMKI